MGKAAHNTSASTVAAVIAAAFGILLVLNPEAAVEGGSHGFDIFINIVFPSLLPFFIVSELMIGLGLVRFLGAFLEPLMRPVFHVPGVGAFAFSMGLAAGYPMDAVITAKLRRSGLCTRIEGERILAFSNTADPLFILGAVAVGMFHDPKLGLVLAVGHYLSTLAVGLLFRFHRAGDDEAASNRTSRRKRLNRKGTGLFAQAILGMLEARREDGRHLGALLADAVEESVKTLLNICGFIMLFSALVALLSSTGLINLLIGPAALLLQLIGWDPSFATGIVAGFFELDIGSAMVAESAGPTYQAVSLVGAIVAWSGLSVHGQIASIIADTDLRLSVYVVARAIHAVLGGVFTYLYTLWPNGALVTRGASQLAEFDVLLPVIGLSLMATIVVTCVTWAVRRF